MQPSNASSSRSIRYNYHTAAPSTTLYIPKSLFLRVYHVRTPIGWFLSPRQPRVIPQISKSIKPCLIPWYYWAGTLILSCAKHSPAPSKNPPYCGSLPSSRIPSMTSPSSLPTSSPISPPVELTTRPMPTSSTWSRYKMSHYRLS